MRTSYHHGDLRSALVAAATELARTDGPDGVVLREAARRTGVSHNAAYRHFADRDDLIAEVAGVGMALLEEAMRARIAEVRVRDRKRAARARLRAVGLAYVTFALTEPGLFETAFSGSIKPADDPYQRVGTGPYALLNEVLDDGVAHGVVSPDRRPGAEVLCWAAVHGFALLHLRGPLRVVPAPARDSELDRMLDQIEHSLA